MNHGTPTYWLRHVITIAILAAAIAAPAANAHPGYTGDVVSRYLASHLADSSDVIDRYLTSHSPTNAQPPNPVSDLLNTLQVNRNQQLAAQNPVSDMADSLAVTRNNSRLAAHAPLTANTTAQSVRRSFSWRDAGIGAAAVVALILLTAASVQLAYRRRGRLAY